MKLSGLSRAAITKLKIAYSSPEEQERYKNYYTDVNEETVIDESDMGTIVDQVSTLSDQLAEVLESNFGTDNMNSKLMYSALNESTDPEIKALYTEYAENLYSSYRYVARELDSLMNFLVKIGYMG